MSRRHLITPPPSPPGGAPAPAVPIPPQLPPAAPTPTLPAQINAATRQQHIELNRLIVDRLRLALPPNQKSPELYGHGLAAFAQIYLMFEEVWSEIEEGERLSPSTNGLRKWLARARPRGLDRTARLTNDLRNISTRTGVSMEAMWRPGPRVRPSRLHRMEEDVRSNPGTLFAYGWVMYMAIFSGGRWIREELNNAGADFWTQRDPLLPAADIKSSYTKPGFSFLAFGNDEDGEDIKTLFRARLAEAEAIFTPQGRQDITDGAVQLFDDCIALVHDLDKFVVRRAFMERATAMVPYLLVTAVLWSVFMAVYDIHKVRGWLRMIGEALA